MGYEVIVAAIREEAKKWQRMADDMIPVANIVADAVLSGSAFMVMSPSAMPNPESLVLAEVYKQLREATSRQLNGAAAEFDEIAGALNRCADEYEKAEEICELNLEQIYSK